MTEQPTEADATPAYTLGSVADSHEVTLSGMAGFPHVAQMYGPTVLTDVAILTLTYSRCRYAAGVPGVRRRSGPEGDDYQLTRVHVDGWRVRKNGTRGGVPKSTWWIESEMAELPEWIVTLADRYRPMNSRVGREQPQGGGA